MTEFRVGRGHDGPARLGEYIMGTEVFENPMLTGPNISHEKMLQYGTMGRDLSNSQPTIAALPFGMKLEEIDKAGLGDFDSVLLPSLISFSSLDVQTSVLTLRHQLDAIDEIKETIDPSRLIVRIPENLDIDVFKSYITDFHSKGIRAAAFMFDGYLGSTDLDSIILRSNLPASWLALALGKIAPSTVPLLYYTGFDVIDTGYAYETAATGVCSNWCSAMA